jgi:hypothetical protein
MVARPPGLSRDSPFYPASVFPFDNVSQALKENDSRCSYRVTLRICLINHSIVNV